MRSCFIHTTTSHYNLSKSVYRPQNQRYVLRIVVLLLKRAPSFTKTSVAYVTYENTMYYLGSLKRNNHNKIASAVTRCFLK